MKKALYVFMSALLAAILLVGCGGEEKKEDTEQKEPEKEKKAAKKDNEKGDYTILIGGELSEEEDKFVIEGTSNLLPGSRLTGEVLLDGEEVFSDTTELVEEDGTFHMELDHHKYGEAEVIVRFDFDNVQEDEIIRHYGDKGQKLEGPFIYKHKTFDGIYKKAEAKIAYIPGETLNLTFEEPNWEPLPEDYGDPRVWIEVEEITEDGEFFYIHAKSNLLEGSELHARYVMKYDTANVKPDGTIDFKIEYEYAEGEDFEIEFKPSRLQWNEIEEAYGSKGQKLVGNLVVTNEYNTEEQFIELVVPWDKENAQPNEDSPEDDEENGDD